MNLSWYEDHYKMLSKLPLSAFSLSMHEVVCNGLDKVKIRETDDNIARDYRGLIQQMPEELINAFSEIEVANRPTETILTLWQQLKPRVTFTNLLDAISKMTRYDILDDLEPLFALSRIQLSRKFSDSDDLPIEIIDRQTWGAKSRSSNSPPTLLHLPVDVIILTNCFENDVNDYYQIAQRRQSRSINRYGATDIDCNFLITPDGKVLEGTGWNIECGHAIRQVKWSLIITLIGNYNEQFPDERMMAAILALLNYGVSKGYIDSHYGIYPMSSVTITDDCEPGQNIIDIIKTWNEFEAMDDFKMTEHFT